MNSDQNKNENEILDVSQNITNTSNNFPFAHNLNVEMANVNYADLIETLEETEPSSVFGTIMASIRILNRIIALTGVFGKAQEAISIVRDILALIRPQTTNDLITHVEQLIHQTLTTQYRNAATQAVNDIQRSYNTYLTFFEQWRANQTQANGQMVESAFVDTNRACNSALNQPLSRIGFETLLLPNYALAASLHLLLLRDAVNHRYKWLTSGNSRSANYDLLTSSLKIYTNYCIHWYQDGLSRFPRSNTRSWLQFNTYRRDMTLSVLDLVAVFPTYDPIIYPNDTDVELSRIVYTDPVGATNGSLPSRWYADQYTNFNNMEERATLPPVRAASFSRIDIFTEYHPTPHNVSSREFWAGNTNSLMSIGSSTIDMSRSYGRNSNWASNNLSIGNNDVFRVNMTAHATSRENPPASFGIHRAEFIAADGQRFEYIRPNTFNNMQSINVFLPGESSLEPTASDYTHRLLEMICVPLTRRDSAVYSHAWVHKSLKRQNIFRSDKIAQIPAIKTESASGTHAVLRGPGSTGGDIVRLDDSTTGLFYILTPANSIAANTRFIIRVRYASITTNRLVLDLNHSSIASLPVQPTVKSGGSLTNLSYQDFKYATFSGNFNLGPSFRLGIFRDMPNTEIVIDKIELIPANLVTSLEQENGNTTNL